MTYRTGIDGVTIVAEGDTRGGDDSRPDQLAAVVVNGDEALAERICALLNASERMPAGPLVYETTKAIHKHLRILGYRYPGVEWDGALAAARAYTERDAYATVVGMLRDAAAELGVDEDAPSARASLPESVQDASGVAECTQDGPDGSRTLTGGTHLPHCDGFFGGRCEPNCPGKDAP